jgi:hypothetical protein
MSGNSLSPLPTDRPAIATIQESSRGTRFDWEALVALTIHPVKVAVVEALHFIGHPLSAPELSELLADSHYGVDAIRYHANGLAKLEVIEVTHVRQARGARERYYFFPPTL